VDARQPAARDAAVAEIAPVDARNSGMEPMSDTADAPLSAAMFVEGHVRVNSFAFFSAALSRHSFSQSMSTLVVSGAESRWRRFFVSLRSSF